MAFEFLGHGANVVGSLGSGSLVQNMPSAMQLNGTNAYASGSTTMSTVTGTTATIAMWVYYTGSQTNQGEKVLFSDSSSETRKILMQTRNYSSHSTSFRFGYVDSAGGGLAAKDMGGSAGVLTSGTWQHFAIVTDGNNVSLHVDGVLYSDGTYASAGTHSYAIARPHLGRAAFSDGRYFPGYIRDVQAYNVSSSTAQLGQIMNGELPHGTPIHWWTCDDGATNDDGSATDSDLTLTNTVEDKSKYELNQIGLGSVSGSATVSGGAWNLKNSSYISPTGTNTTNSNWVQLNNDQSVDGSRSYAMWLYLGETGSTQILLDNYDGSDGTRVFINGGTPKLYLRLNNSNISFFDANANEWNHLVWTIDETNNLAKAYLNGVEKTSSSNNKTYADVNNMRIGAQTDDDYPTNAGNYISEYVYYTSVLTPTQIDLLYKGQWIGSPETWLKMDEGTGTSITNHGTDGATATLTGVSSNIPAWVNPTYDLNGRLTITADGTVSAPKGDFDIDENFQNYGTFTHNSGTVVFTAGDNSFINTEGTVDPVFYNVTSEKNQLRFYNDVTIERQLQLDAAASHCYIWANKTLTMGSTTSPETGYPKLINNMNDGDKQFWFYAGSGQTATLQGVSELYPIIFTKAQASADIEWGYHASSAAQIKNVDFQCDIETDTSDTLDSIKLTGDCEFDKLTISNGDRINLNGQRVKFGDDFTVNSGGHNNGAGLIFAEGDYTENGTGNGYTTKTLVMDGGYCNPAQTTWKQMFLRDGTHTIGGNRDWGGTPVIIAGTSNFTSNNTWGNITIPTAGILSGNSAVITSEGDFNMAGGLIGKSALVFDNSGDYVDCGYDASTDITNTLTMTAWIKSTGTDSYEHIICKQGGYYFLSIIQHGGVGKAIIRIYDGANIDAMGTSQINDGKWHHIAGTYDTSAGKLRIYVDGKLEAETDNSDAISHGSNKKIFIGANDTSSNIFNGTIAQASLWNVALTQAQIRAKIFSDFASLDSNTGCIGWWQFDEGTGTTVDNKGSEAADLDGTITNATWVSPGTYTYGTSTLKFDKAGACNLIGHQDATATQLHSIHITSGTTVTANCRDNDLVMNSGSLMTNSGSLLSNRNWQYKSRNMPIVGPNSDLKVTSNIWYYMSDGSGLPASGAGTDYYQLRPSTEVWMQGDFDCQNGLLQSGGDLHLNGHTCSTSKIWNYGGGNIHAEPGSSIVFDTEYGFNTSYGENPTTMFFVASGEACAMFNQFVDLNNSSNQNYIDTNAAIVPDDAAFTVSFWYKSPTNIADYSDTLTTAIGFNYNSEGGISLIGSNWLILCQGSVYRYFNSAPNADGLWHHMLAYVDPTNASNIKMWIDGSEQTPNSTATGGTTSWSGDVQFGRGGYGAMPVSLSDIRFYNAANTPTGSVATLAAINPATNVSGAYADPSNALSAYGWFKLNGTDKGLVSIADTIGTYNSAAFGTLGSPANGVKSGFVTISGSVTPFNPINNLYPAGVTLQNTYISGSKDIIVGQRKENSAGFMAVPSQTLTTKGTVTLE